MSFSLMNGYISDEMDSKHSSVFSESVAASRYLDNFLPNHGDSELFYSETDYTWIQLVNHNGRLWIEVGEPAA